MSEFTKERARRAALDLFLQTHLNKSVPVEILCDWMFASGMEYAEFLRNKADGCSDMFKPENKEKDL